MLRPMPGDRGPAEPARGVDLPRHRPPRRRPGRRSGRRSAAVRNSPRKAEIVITSAPDVQETCHPVTRDAVTTLLARWRAAGTEFVVVDERGRHAAELRAGRLDLTRSADMLDAR